MLGRGHHDCGSDNSEDLLSTDVGRRGQRSSYALLGEAVMGATKICHGHGHDQQMTEDTDLEACQH